MQSTPTHDPASPGYFQTHAAAGATWRSAPLARLLDEETVALFVQAFNTGQWGDVDVKTAHANHSALIRHLGPLKGVYRFSEWTLIVTADASCPKPTVRAQGEP